MYQLERKFSFFRWRRALLATFLSLFLASLGAQSAGGFAPQEVPADPSLWTKIERKQLPAILADQRIAAQLKLKEALVIRAPQDPDTRRAAEWVAKLDRAFRKADPSRSASIPVPEVYVLEASIVNAFTTTTPVICYSNVSITLPSTQGKTEELSSLFGASCPQSEDLSPAEVAEFIARFAKISGGCRLESSGSSPGEKLSFTLEGSCEAQKLAAARGVARIQGWYAWFPRPTMVNAITLTSGIFARPEGELVAMLFHELGHYYAAHSAQPPADLWIQLSEKGPARVLSEKEPLRAEIDFFKSACLSSQPPQDPADCRRRFEALKAQHLINYTAEDRADDWALDYLRRLKLDSNWLTQWLTPRDKTCPAFDVRAPWPSSLFAELSPRDYASVHHTPCFRVKRIQAAQADQSQVSLKGAKQ